MPLYVYVCSPCRKSRTDMRKIEQRHDGPKCDSCGQQMSLEIGATPGIVKNPAVPKKS